MNEDEIRMFLRRPRVAALTTLGPDGWPHPIAMWFVPRDRSLLMWAYTKSQKVVNLRRDPRAGLLVESGSRYGELKGVAVRGNARLIDDAAAVQKIGVDLYRRYVEPHTGIPVGDGPIADIERQTRKRTGIELSIDGLTSWDFTKQ